MPIDRYRGISLQRELVDRIEEFIKNHPERGYKSLADFVTEAVRKRCEELKILVPTPPKLPSLEHFNLNEHGVMVLDRDLNSIVQVYFKPDKVICEHCGGGCRHIEFALSIPKVQEILREKGWKPRT